MDIETMRYYYINGLWSKERLEKLLNAEKITQSQYDDIVSEETKKNIETV